MNRFLTLSICFLVTFSSFSQGKKGRKKDADAKGTLFFYWGYNRSFYTKSNIHFKGSGYDFNMAEARAQDNPSKLGWHYFKPNAITIPQFNVRLGYYFKDNWAISIGYDHMKYIFNDNNQVKLSGYVTPGLDTVTNLSGNYDNMDYTTDRTKFHYENSDGLNYLRIEVMNSKQWYRTRSGWFGFTTNIGASIGGVLSYNDFRFAGQNDMRTISLSGYGLSAHLGLRFEFFRHVFLQAGYSAGFMHQVKVKTRPNDITASARQAFGFMEMDAVIGALFYIRSKNNCNSCPHW